MTTSYTDRWIELNENELAIRGYYFPWGPTKRIPYEKIRHVTRVTLGAINGRARIWGTANPGVWTNLDLRRPTKHTGFLIDYGRGITPLLTPDDPEAAERTLRAHLADGIISEGSRRAPIV